MIIYVIMGDLDDNSDIDDILGLPSEKVASITPSFSDLFEDEVEGGNSDLDREEFEDIKEFKGKPQKTIFGEKFYKIVLNGEGEIAQKLHKSLASFLNAKEPEDKTMFRNRLQPVVWDMTEQVAQKVGGSLTNEKKIFLRFALLLPSLIKKAQKENLASVIMDNNTGEPVHYLDEWLEMVSQGEVQPLGSDEEPVKTKNKSSNGLRMQRDKFKGAYDSRVTTLKHHQKKRSQLENNIVKCVNSLGDHTPDPAITTIQMSYSIIQKNALTDIVNTVKNLQELDREYNVALHEAKAAQAKLIDMQGRIDDEPSEAVNPAVLKKEVNNIRQIHKMCVGRQGNHFPLLSGSYFSSNFNDMATREQILTIMKQIEGIDPSIFRRTHRRETHRIVPHVIIIPCYGDEGICWEPFEKFNRSTSRGRIAVPLYPKNLKLTIITAMADLKWEVAKAKAQNYWMEEGITGKYFQWFEERKLRGDVKQKFIDDYILWVTKESEGTQKLDKEVRGIFWRNIPFPKELRTRLKNRGFVYSELYKKDSNREMSDGY